MVNAFGISQFLGDIIYVADATKMPFEPDYFDFACISFGLHDMPHEVRHQVLDEMRRVSEKIIVVDYHIPKNRLRRWLYVSFTSLYESKYYRDFAKRNLEELLREHDFRIVKEAYGLVDLLRYFCVSVNPLGKAKNE